MVTIMQNPRQYKIPDWFLNRQKDIRDGKYSQVKKKKKNMHSFKILFAGVSEMNAGINLIICVWYVSGDSCCPTILKVSFEKISRD